MSSTMAAYLSENPAIEWKFTWIFFPRAFRVVSIKSGKKNNKGRLFLVCRKEVVRRKEDMGLFACKGQYLLARYFRCVHTTRKSSVSCAGQMAGKGVRLID